VSRSTVENQDATWLYLRAPTASPLRVADPRPVPHDQIKILPRQGVIIDNALEMPKLRECQIVKNRTCKGRWAGLRFALFLGKTLKFVACSPRVETIDLWQLKFE
jgi:hypothetical protein